MNRNITNWGLLAPSLHNLERNPLQLERLRSDPALIPSAVEELLRYESPSQHTVRVAPEDGDLAGRLISRGQAVIAVLGAANRDPAIFPEPDRNYVILLQSAKLGGASSENLFIGSAVIAGVADVGVVKTH